MGEEICEEGVINYCCFLLHLLLLPLLPLFGYPFVSVAYTHIHTHTQTDAAYLNATKLYTVFTRETVLAMKSILSNAYIYTIGAVPELYVTNATLEAFDVIEQSQAFDGHGRTLTCGNGG